MFVAKEIIAEVNRRTDIVDVISDYVALKQAGSNYKGLCPFHSEKTPSFTVSRSEGFFHCFGCKESGNTITFLQKHLNITFVEAVKILGLRYGVNVEATDDNRADSDEGVMYKIYDSAKDFYIAELYRIGDKALEFYKQRGLSDATIIKFGLGYSPNIFGGSQQQHTNSGSLLKHFSNSGYSSEILIKSGLLREKEGRIYDFFRNRAMFPIRDFIGRTIAFGARQLDKEDKLGKYINSAESLIYDKKQVLYGIYEAKSEIRKTKTAFIVEGYLDVISLEQAGIYNVVAPCGTSLSLEQLRYLKKHTGCEIIYFVFDGDEAGERATIRGIDIALQLGFDLRIITLPDGQDPDTFINTDNGKDKFNDLCNESKNFIEYIYTSLLDKNLLNRPAEKSAAIRNLIRMLLLHPDKLQHKYYIDFIVNLFDADIVELRKLYAKMREELKEAEQRKSFEATNKSDLNDLVKPEVTIDDFLKVMDTDYDEIYMPDDLTAEVLHPAEKVLFSYILQRNENFKFVSDKYKFDESFLVTGIGNDIFCYLKENEDSENIFQSLLENGEVPEHIKKLLSELKMQEINNSERWVEVSNIKISNTEYELVYIPLLQLRIERIVNELKELKQKLSQNLNDNKIAKRIQHLTKKRMEYTNELNKTAL